VPANAPIELGSIHPFGSFKVVEPKCYVTLFKDQNFAGQTANVAPNAYNSCIYAGPGGNLNAVGYASVRAAGSAPITCSGVNGACTSDANCCSGRCGAQAGVCLAPDVPPPPNQTVYATLYSDTSCNGSIVDYVAGPPHVPCEALPRQGANNPTRDPIPFGSFKVTAPNCKVTWYQNPNEQGAQQPDNVTGQCVAARYSGSVTAFSTAPAGSLSKVACGLVGANGCQCSATIGNNKYTATCPSPSSFCVCGINGTAIGDILTHACAPQDFAACDFNFQ
jgi:hypothetical protein